jgi:hypothetical protein
MSVQISIQKEPNSEYLKLPLLKGGGGGVVQQVKKQLFFGIKITILFT